MHSYSPHHARPPLLLRLLIALITAFILILMTPFVARSEVPGDTLMTVVAVGAAAARDSVVRDSTATAALPMPVVALHGEVRSRSELDRAGGGASADAFTYMRTRFGALAEVGEGARLKLTVQDSRVLGAEGHPTTAASGSFGLHEGWLELERDWRNLQVGAGAGRQEIGLGNKRLIGAVNWSNIGRTFDALRLTMRPLDGANASWSATAFASVIDERGRRFGGPAAAEADASDHIVLGAYATMGRAAGASPSAILLDATLVHDIAGSYRTYRDADRSTFDVRVRIPNMGGVRAELEGAVQVGNQRWLPADELQSPVNQDVRAWLAGARLGTAAPMGRLTSATLGLDVLSGDENATDGRYEAFTTPYATNHPFYGLMDVFLDPAARTGDRGLTDMFASAVVRLHPAVSLRSDVHRYALTTGDRDELGWEFDFIAPVRVTNNAALELGYGVYRASDSAAPLALHSSEWGYAQLRVWF